MSARTRPETAGCPFHAPVPDAGEVVLFAPTARRAVEAPPPKARPAATGIEPGTTGQVAPFSPDDVQSNVIRSVNPDQAHYLFFRIVDAARARRLIAALVDPPPADPAAEGSLVAALFKVRRLPT